jgi:hypothetical protein
MDHQTSMETDMFSYDNCGLMFGKLHDLQKHAKKWCSENQRKSTFERKLSTENEDRDQTGSGLEAKAPRWRQVVFVKVLSKVTSLAAPVIINPSLVVYKYNRRILRTWIF